MRGKKGTDKPIEIFIALFIILAVAMVILKMFSGQIQDKTKELQRIEMREKFQQAKGDAQRECTEICTAALQNDCNMQQKAMFCQHKVIGGLDINMDGTTRDYSEDLLSGIGICEDTVYCPHITTCQCKGKLEMKDCVDVLYTFYTQSMGLDRDSACTLLNSRIVPGNCNIPEDGIHWLDILQPEIGRYCS